ncbi:hypothetical protein T484DRAFT_1874140, partial [Baffinella frigidus]
MGTESDEENTQCGSGEAKRKKSKVHKFTCPVDGCNESRRRPGELQQHDDFVHNGIYHNVCNHIYENGDKCVFKCETPGSLDSHMRHMHSDVCDVKCTDCTAAFKTKQDRYIHWVRRHSAANHPARTEYKCKECNHKGFPTSGNLASHCLRKHAPTDDPKLAAMRK